MGKYTTGDLVEPAGLERLRVAVYRRLGEHVKPLTLAKVKAKRIPHWEKLRGPAVQVSLAYGHAALLSTVREVFAADLLSSSYNGGDGVRQLSERMASELLTMVNRRGPLS